MIRCFLLSRVIGEGFESHLDLFRLIRLEGHELSERLEPVLLDFQLVPAGDRSDLEGLVIPRPLESDLTAVDEDFRILRDVLQDDRPVRRLDPETSPPTTQREARTSILPQPPPARPKADAGARGAVLGFEAADLFE